MFFFSALKPTVERWEKPLIYGNPKLTPPCINFKSLWEQRLHIFCYENMKVHFSLKIVYYVIEIADASVHFGDFKHCINYLNK